MSETLILLAVLATSPQTKNTLIYGGHRFAINEIPMLGYWDYGEESVGTGKVSPPKFDFQGFNNWAGYEATWRIHGSKLYLSKIKAKQNRKLVKNDQIIPKQRFPLLADWYSGRIHLLVGGRNFEKEQFESVIVCHLEKGVVKRMTFEPFLKSIYIFGWNGLSAQPRKPMQSSS